MRARPFTREEESGQLRITGLCCGLGSGQAVQGVTSNSMLLVVIRDVTRDGAPYNAVLYVYNVVSMHAQHEVVCTSMRVICG